MSEGEEEGEEEENETLLFTFMLVLLCFSCVMSLMDGFDSTRMQETSPPNKYFQWSFSFFIALLLLLLLLVLKELREENC